MSKLRKVPKGALKPEEEKALNKLGDGYAIKERDLYEHCVCDEEEKVRACYDPRSCKAEEIVKAVKKDLTQESQRAS